LRLGLEVAEEMGDLRAQARILNGLGFVGYYEGRWTEALDFYERSRDLYATVGDAAMPPVLGLNIAEIYCERGNLDEAEAILGDSLRVWQASGHRYFVAACLTTLARVAARAHRFEEALAMFDEALALFVDVAGPEESIEVVARAAECRVLMGDSERALELTDEAQAKTEGTDTGGQSIPLIHRTRGYALAQLARPAEARTAFEAALEAARARGQDLDVALTLHALVRLGGVDGLPLSGDAEPERDAILERLGVGSVAEVPLMLARA
jgi:tetratricopeptide (TPR) repeat protein